jgi:transcription initiation factor TFIIIB Brf1 subunit/transcription initiation factor TFIIB
MSRPPLSPNCSRCGTPLQESLVTRKRRHPKWVCDGCGLGHHNEELRKEIEKRWRARGSPRVGDPH